MGFGGKVLSNQPSQITVTSAGRILESGKGKLQQEDRQEEGKSRI